MHFLLRTSRASLKQLDLVGLVSLEVIPALRAIGDLHSLTSLQLIGSWFTVPYKPLISILKDMEKCTTLRSLSIEAAFFPDSKCALLQSLTELTALRILEPHHGMRIDSSLTAESLQSLMSLQKLQHLQFQARRDLGRQLVVPEDADADADADAVGSKLQTLLLSARVTNAGSLCRSIAMLCPGVRALSFRHNGPLDSPSQSNGALLKSLADFPNLEWADVTIQDAFVSNGTIATLQCAPRLRTLVVTGVLSADSVARMQALSDSWQQRGGLGLQVNDGRNAAENQFKPQVDSWVDVSSAEGVVRRLEASFTDGELCKAGESFVPHVEWVRSAPGGHAPAVLRYPRTSLLSFQKRLECQQLRNSTLPADLLASSARW